MIPQFGYRLDDMRDDDSPSVEGFASPHEVREPRGVYVVQRCA